jgi:hypothetical protein
LHSLTKTHFQLRITFKRLELSLYFLLGPTIVRVEKRYELSSCQLHSTISCWTNPGMNLMAVPYSPSSEALCDFTALIRRPIIDDYHFEAPVCLAEHAFYRLSEIAVVVIDGDDYAD